MPPDPAHPTHLHSRHVVRQLLDAGIITHIQRHLPIQEMIEIGDALLASPVLAALVTCESPHALDVISALKQRGGEHILVGASNVRSSQDVERAVGAGAQWLLAPQLHARACARAEALGIPYLPGVLTRAEAERTLAAGHDLHCLFPADIFGPDHLHELGEALPAVRFLAAGDIAPDEVSAYAAAGAAALIVNAILPDGAWTQAEIITAAREMNELWAASNNSVQSPSPP